MYVCKNSDKYSSINQGFNHFVHNEIFEKEFNEIYGSDFTKRCIKTIMELFMMYSCELYRDLYCKLINNIVLHWTDDQITQMAVEILMYVPVNSPRRWAVGDINKAIIMKKCGFEKMIVLLMKRIEDDSKKANLCTYVGITYNNQMNNIIVQLTGVLVKICGMDKFDHNFEKVFDLIKHNREISIKFCKDCYEELTIRSKTDNQHSLDMTVDYLCETDFDEFIKNVDSGGSL